MLGWFYIFIHEQGAIVMIRTTNFNAGPAALPLEVLQKAKDEFLDFNGAGMSVMELSHRSKEYDDYVVRRFVFGEEVHRNH